VGGTRRSRLVDELRAAVAISAAFLMQWLLF
jgi:hypothetical protein